MAAVTSIVAISAALAATTAAGGYMAKSQLDDAKNARRNQERLETQRRQELVNEASAREAAAAKAATTGQRVGTRMSFMSAFGFGSGNTQAGLGSGNLFGN